jgi:hypothetical protein
MPFRTITVDGATWRVQPVGLTTPYTRDEFSLVFTREDPAPRETRVTRYSPRAARTREASFMALTNDDLAVLLVHSQPSGTSPEAFYTR